MSDICKCLNEECPAKQSCYRYTVEPHPYWQAYSDFRPEADGVCMDFMPIYKKENNLKEEI